MWILSEVSTRVYPSVTFYSPKETSNVAAIVLPVAASLMQQSIDLTPSVQAVHACLSSQSIVSSPRPLNDSNEHDDNTSILAPGRWCMYHRRETRSLRIPKDRPSGPPLINIANSREGTSTGNGKITAWPPPRAQRRVHVPLT